jgi:hypothetical protein
MSATGTGWERSVGGLHHEYIAARGMRPSFGRCASESNNHPFENSSLFHCGNYPAGFSRKIQGTTSCLGKQSSHAAGYEGLHSPGPREWRPADSRPRFSASAFRFARSRRLLTALIPTPGPRFLAR